MSEQENYEEKDGGTLNKLSWNDLIKFIKHIRRNWRNQTSWKRKQFTYTIKVN